MSVFIQNLSSVAFKDYGIPIAFWMNTESRQWRYNIMIYIIKLWQKLYCKHHRQSKNFVYKKQIIQINNIRKTNSLNPTRQQQELEQEFEISYENIPHLSLNNKNNQRVNKSIGWFIS